MFATASCVCYGPASQFENIWLRTKRKNADGTVVGGSGGVCYLYFPGHAGTDSAAGTGGAGDPLSMCTLKVASMT